MATRPDACTSAAKSVGTNESLMPRPPPPPRPRPSVGILYRRIRQHQAGPPGGKGEFGKAGAPAGLFSVQWIRLPLIHQVQRYDCCSSSSVSCRCLLLLLALLALFISGKVLPCEPHDDLGVDMFDLMGVSAPGVITGFRLRRPSCGGGIV